MFRVWPSINRRATPRSAVRVPMTPWKKVFHCCRQGCRFCLVLVRTEGIDRDCRQFNKDKDGEEVRGEPDSHGAGKGKEEERVIELDRSFGIETFLPMPMPQRPRYPLPGDHRSARYRRSPGRPRAGRGRRGAGRRPQRGRSRSGSRTSGGGSAGGAFAMKYIPIPQSAMKKGMNPAISTGFITPPPG